MKNKHVTGSHQAGTYLTPRAWWMRPFNFMAKCQEVDFKQQYKCGSRFFDFRLRFDNSGNPFFAHGLAEYKFTKKDKFQSVFDVLKYLDSLPDVIGVQITLECLHEDSAQEYDFVFFCKKIRKDYPNINFCGGTPKYDWLKVLYNFEWKPFSMSMEFARSESGKFVFPFPKYHAKKINPKVFERDFKDFGVDMLQMDFVNIR